MDIPLEKEICNHLSHEGISIESHKDIASKIYISCGFLRSHLEKLEKEQKPCSILQNSFWKLTSKYRFDVLANDIPRIARQLAYAIGFSAVYLNQVSDNASLYCPTYADGFFWYHIDSGIRLASSGWDRLALLLDLAFELDIGPRNSISKALAEISKSNNNLIQTEFFKALKKFKDEDLADLENGIGRGARHETTHLFSPSTRIFFEFLESQSGKAERISARDKAHEWYQMLVKHYKLYLSGIESVVNLVHFHWQGNRI